MVGRVLEENNTAYPQTSLTATRSFCMHFEPAMKNSNSRLLTYTPWHGGVCGRRGQAEASRARFLREVCDSWGSLLAYTPLHAQPRLRTVRAGRGQGGPRSRGYKQLPAARTVGLYPGRLMLPLMTVSLAYVEVDYYRVTLQPADTACRTRDS